MFAIALTAFAVGLVLFVVSFTNKNLERWMVANRFNTKGLLVGLFFVAVVPAMMGGGLAFAVLSLLI